jgi:hypothetical protein
MPRASFLKPSLLNNYVTHEHVKPRVEPNPTLKFLTYHLGMVFIFSFHFFLIMFLKLEMEDPILELK